MVVQKGSSGAAAKAQNPAGQSANYEQISQEPMKHVITFIEKKIRNLDKRKAKLDGYRKMVENGQPLDPDQTAAASKYDEVIGSLEFAKDLVKSFEITTTEVMKQQRKATRREQIAREEADNNRICFVMRATRILELLQENELIKEDFLNGTNGACVISKVELEQLVNFHEVFIMKSYDAGTNVIEDGNSAGNHMYELAEGRSKDIVGTTYKELRNVIDRIHDCKYFEEIPDTNKIAEIHKTPEKEEVESVTSESSAEEEKLEKEEEEEDQTEEVEPAAAPEPNVMSPNSSEPLSSPSGFSADVPLKTEEFLPSAQPTGMYPTTHADTNWQPQTVQPKPEAGDYVSQNMTFNYVSDTNTIMPQPATYPVQTIQDVLADVQGPCQFLQDSVIDFEVPALPGLSFTGMDVHQQPAQKTLTPVSRPHQIDQGLPAAGHLQPGFPLQRTASPVDQNNVLSSQGLPGTQQHLAPNRDSPSHLTNTVTHPEHIESPIDQVQNPLHMTSQAVNSETNQQDSNYHGNAPYMSKLPATNPVRTSPQSNMEYTMTHQQQTQAPRQAADNLGLGQTTFGGQQQVAGGTHVGYIQQAGDGNVYQQENTAQTETFTPNTFDATSSALTPASGMGNMMQHSLTTSMQAPDPPTTHIPLPNEQQSGYRSYQPNEMPHKDSDQGQGVDAHSNDQGSVGTNAMKNSVQHQDRNVSEMRVNDVQDTHVTSTGDGSTAQKQHGDAQGHADQGSGYGNRGGVGNRQMGGTSGRPGRGYSGQGGGYRSGSMNQGGGNFHQQRNNYRPGPRYSGNYDSMGRPNNFTGGYQNSQSNYGMGGGYRQQDQYYRRGAGGNMRGGRGGHQPRGGNPRGGGNNYNRTRTFRPQHSSEQAA